MLATTSLITVGLLILTIQFQTPDSLNLNRLGQEDFAGVTITLNVSLLLLFDAGEEVVLLVVLATAVVLKEVVSSFLTTTNVPFIL